MIRSAVVTTLFLVLLEALGARSHVAVLSGTLAGGKAVLFLGLLYAMTFLTVALVVPPLLLAGLLDALAARRSQASERA
ncbi:MAG: hypothetical protein SFW67_28740 [Myxococcaceae bacterium]|nr:hypothetical protein [Myxococcaceae bacterium]